MTWSWMPPGIVRRPERLEQPRADQRVGDERVDDGHDGGADQAQEDRVDAQRRVGCRALDVGRERRPGQQGDRVRDGIERRQAGDELEEDAPTRRPARRGSRRSGGSAAARARGSGRAEPRPRLFVLLDRIRIGRSARRRRRSGRSRLRPRRLRRSHVDEDQVRVGRRRHRAASSTVRSACSRAIGDRIRRPAGSADSRDVRTRPARAEARAGLAVDGGRHEAGRRQRRRRERHRIREELGDVRAELLVEHPDDDPDRRVELGCGERRVQVGRGRRRRSGRWRRPSRPRPRAGRGVRSGSPTTRRTPTVGQVARRRRRSARCRRRSSSRVRSSSIVRRPRWSRPQTMT